MSQADAHQIYSRVNLVSDPIYGYIRITKRIHSSHTAEQDILDNIWMQRLRRIHQLQSAWWVFPTGEHSRFQHALGSMELAGKWAKHIYSSLDKNMTNVPSENLFEETARIAGLLHDIGHGPFGHFFDREYLSKFNLDHELIGRHIITHELLDIIEGLDSSPSGSFEQNERIDPKWIAYLISTPPLEGFNPPDWLKPLKFLLCGPFSADNMDYVPRDSYLCGVAVGPVDVERLIHYTFVHDGHLVLHRHGVEALIMFLTARHYLYSNIYFHRTVRRIDLQLQEIFKPTIEKILGGNPLSFLSDYLDLTEWKLIDTVLNWARHPVDGETKLLGEKWLALIERKLQWHLAASRTYDLRGQAPDLKVLEDKIIARINNDILHGKTNIILRPDIVDLKPLPQPPGELELMVYDPDLDKLVHPSEVEQFRRLPDLTLMIRIYSQPEISDQSVISQLNQILSDQALVD